MDSGDGESAPAVECRERDGDQVAGRREQHGRVEGFGRRVVGSLRRRHPQLERELLGVVGAGHDVHGRSFVERDLGGQVR